MVIMLQERCKSVMFERKEELMKPLRSPHESLRKAVSSDQPKTADLNKRPSPTTSLPRRDFFRIGGITAAGALGLPAVLKASSTQASEAAGTSSQRRNRAYQIRQQAAMAQ